MQNLDVAFVDDTNNRCNHFTHRPQPPVATLIEKASSDAQIWHDILESINQAMAPTKSKYHLLRYDFGPLGDPSLTIEDHPPHPLTVRDKHGTVIEIDHVPSNKAIKYLGCHKAPEGQTQQKQKSPIPVT